VVETQLRVLYADTDQMGVVYYGAYLRFFEAGRNEYIRSRGLRYRDFEERFGLRLPVAEVGVKYRAPARYDDVVTVETSLTELRRASARFGYRLMRDGTVLATGFTLHACVDTAGGLQRLPDELVALLEEEGARRDGGGG
jgi:acyl-CoA thioester hydrolase